MFKPHPEEQILRHGENIPQHVNLKLVERLIDICFEQCLQLMQPILNFQLRLRINDVAILVRIRNRGAVTRMTEPQALRRCRKQARLQT